MILRHKGFSLERQPCSFSSRARRFEYKVYHVVTGTYAGTFDSLREAREEVDVIHQHAEDYARFAGCLASELRYDAQRHRYTYKLNRTPRFPL